MTYSKKRKSLNEKLEKKEEKTILFLKKNRKNQQNPRLRLLDENGELEPHF